MKINMKFSVWLDKENVHSADYELEFVKKVTLLGDEETYRYNHPMIRSAYFEFFKNKKNEYSFRTVRVWNCSFGGPQETCDFWRNFKFEEDHTIENDGLKQTTTFYIKKDEEIKKSKQNYQWIAKIYSDKFDKNLGEHLSDFDSSGWEIFQIISTSSGYYTIVCRRLK